MKLMESSIPTNYTTNLKANGLNWNPVNTYRMYDIIFKSMSDLLALVKRKDTPTAVACRDLKGNLMLAGIVQYHEPEDDNDEVGGNWSYEFTTEEADLEGAIQHQFTDHQFQRVFTQVGMELYNMRVSDSLYITQYTTMAIQALLENLEVNAQDGQVYEIDEEGYFKANSAVENGVKVIGVVPGDKIKTLIKNDGTGEAA